jgi:hypothetical protein
VAAISPSISSLSLVISFLHRMQEADDIWFLLQVLYVLPRTSAGFHRRDKNMGWRATMCYARVSLSHRGQCAPDQRRGRSVPHGVKRTQVALRSPSDVHRCRQDSPPLALFPSVIASPSARKPRKRDNYALGASRQMSGRRKISRWRRQAGADRPVCEPFSSWSQTGQERQMRRNAEGVRPVALLKAVAKC